MKVKIHTNVVLYWPVTDGGDIIIRNDDDDLDDVECDAASVCHVSNDV